MKNERNVIFYHFTATPEGPITESITCTMPEAKKLFNKALKHNKFDYFDITSAKTGDVIRSYEKRIKKHKKRLPFPIRIKEVSYAGT